jgi:uncharacterized metal-binding protein
VERRRCAKKEVGGLKRMRNRRRGRRLGGCAMEGCDMECFHCCVHEVRLTATYELNLNRMKTERSELLI